MHLILLLMLFHELNECANNCSKHSDRSLTFCPLRSVVTAASSCLPFLSSLLMPHPNYMCDNPHPHVWVSSGISSHPTTVFGILFLRFILFCFFYNLLTLKIIFNKTWVIHWCSRSENSFFPYYSIIRRRNLFRTLFVFQNFFH
jgi:hypothetical protein